MQSLNEQTKDSAAWGIHGHSSAKPRSAVETVCVKEGVRDENNCLINLHTSHTLKAFLCGLLWKCSGTKTKIFILCKNTV